MEELVALITQVEYNAHLQPVTFLTDEHHPAVARIRVLLNDLMITEEGDVDKENQSALLRLGWAIYPLDYSQSGWLLGALLTTKGDIVYGC
jgi:hypothetical protein